MNPDSINLGIAPINWTNDDLPELGGSIPFEQCISEMALAGFTGCEVGNKYPRDPAVLKKFLNLRGLRICNQWFSYELTTKTYDENKVAFLQLLDFLEAMGANIIGGGETGTSCQGKPVPVFENKGYFRTEDDWQDFAEKMNRLGTLAVQRGFKLCFHHHMGTSVQTLAETRKFLELTDPEKVWLNYDCGHFLFAGDDPVEALRECLPRVGHVHLKDIRLPVLQQVKEEKLSFLEAVKAGVFTIPGDEEGCIDFDAIFQLLDQHNYQGWIVVEAEQDPARANPLEYALKARNFIRTKTGL